MPFPQRSILHLKACRGQMIPFSSRTLLFSLNAKVQHGAVPARYLRHTYLTALKKKLVARAYPRNMVIEMDEPRCKIAAFEMDDPRCGKLLEGMVIVMEDPRCKNLGQRLVLEMEDPRCSRAAMKMEDPRCQGMFMTW